MYFLISVYFIIFLFSLGCLLITRGKTISQLVIGLEIIIASVCLIFTVGAIKHSNLEGLYIAIFLIAMILFNALIGTAIIKLIDQKFGNRSTNFLSIMRG